MTSKTCHFSIYVKTPRNGKTRSINIKNLNNETTPGKSDSCFVSDHVGDHPKTDSHQTRSKNSNHIACNATHENKLNNTHTKIKMTKTMQ